MEFDWVYDIVPLWMQQLLAKHFKYCLHSGSPAYFIPFPKTFPLADIINFKELLSCGLIFGNRPLPLLNLYRNCNLSSSDCFLYLRTTRELSLYVFVKLSNFFCPKIKKVCQVKLTMQSVLRNFIIHIMSTSLYKTFWI